MTDLERIRTCKRCEVTKSIDQFYLHHGGKHRHVCKLCKRADSQLGYINSIEKRRTTEYMERARARQREYRRSHPERVRASKVKRHARELEARRERARHNLAKELIQNAKYRARKLGIPFNLTIDDIIVPERCPVLGIELRLAQRDEDGKVDHTASPSIDRIVPELGYVRGNVCVISYRANSLKSNATLDEIRSVALYVEQALAWKAAA